MSDQEDAATDARGSLFADANEGLRLLRRVERGLIAALGWMPYQSDVKGDELAALRVDMGHFDAALNSIQAERARVEKQILDAAAGE